LPALTVALTNPFEAILERITDAVFAIDTSWRFTYVNPAATRIFHKTADELIGHNIWTLFPEKVETDCFRYYHQAMATSERMEYETYCEPLGIWARVCLYPSADGLTVYLADITEERQTRESYAAHLADSEERYRTVADFTYDLEYWRGPDGTLLYISPSCERITGYPAEDFFANPALLERIIHPAERRRIRHHFLIEMQSDETYTLDFRIIHRDGGIRWINHACQPVYNADGVFLGRRGSNRDITERKGMETELERERALLTAVLDQLPVGVVIAEVPSGRVIRANARMEQIYRYPVHLSTEAKQFCRCQAFHQDGRPYQPEERPIMRVVANGETIIDEEIYLHTGDGMQAVILVSAAPVHDREGRLVAGVVVAHDVTAYKELDRAKDEFLAVLSHELKTPLTSILGWAEFALGQNSTEQLQQAMTVVYRNARRQQRLIDELLNMSRLQHQRMDMVLESTDLCRLARAAVARATEAAEKTGVAIVLNPAQDALPLHVDPGRIALCIDYLLSNGLKFTPVGGTVSISCCSEGERAMLIVQDTGRGIAPEALPIIFTPFRQVDRDEAAGGLGLGLAIVRGIVELHDGRVTAASPGLNQGSTITIELPLQANDGPSDRGGKGRNAKARAYYR